MNHIDHLDDDFEQITTTWLFYECICLQDIFSAARHTDTHALSEVEALRRSNVAVLSESQSKFQKLYAEKTRLNAQVWNLSIELSGWETHVPFLM